MSLRQNIPKDEMKTENKKMVRKGELNVNQNITSKIETRRRIEAQIRLYYELSLNRRQLWQIKTNG